jgi:hypothetical protein
MDSIQSSNINPDLWSRPYWNGYRPLLKHFDGEAFPDTKCLDDLLPPDAKSGGSKPLRFVQAGEIPGVDYERHIYETGEVSTRAGNWHDLFNALVWCRLPQMKAALNALHYGQLDCEKQGRRGRLRDALTLLDESGVVVLTRNRDILDALTERDWPRAFQEHRDAWKARVRVVVCGHGLLEKFLHPYKSITAHALLCQVECPASGEIGKYPLETADAALAQLLLEGALSTGPENLSPLPLMGIPGWWPVGAQDQAFYDDPGVFRAAPQGFMPAPVHGI